MQKAPGKPFQSLSFAEVGNGACDLRVPGKVLHRKRSLVVEESGDDLDSHILGDGGCSPEYRVEWHGLNHQGGIIETGSGQSRLDPFSNPVLGSEGPGQVQGRHQQPGGNGSGGGWAEQKSETACQ